MLKSFFIHFFLGSLLKQGKETFNLVAGSILSVPPPAVGQVRSTTPVTHFDELSTLNQHPF